MDLHSFDAARQAGFQALQFNLVLTSSAAAIGLWRSLSMTEIGRLPEKSFAMRALASSTQW